MLKQKRQVFEFLYIAADLLVVVFSWLLAYALRFKTNWVPVLYGVPEFSNYLSLLIFILPIWVFVYKRMGLYRPMRGVRRLKEIWLLLNANGLAVIILIALTYLFKEKSEPYSRLVFIYFGVLSTVISVSQRSFLRFFLREVRRRGYNLRYMLIVGSGKVAADVASRIRLHRELGIQLLGCLSREGTEEKGPWGLPILGAYKDLKRLLSDLDIDQVVVALPLEDHDCFKEILEEIGDSLVDVKIVPDIYRFVSVGGSIEEFEGLPVISIQDSPLNGMNLHVKRIVDVIISSTALVLLALPLLVVAILIKLTSRGPILYTQERVSLDGTPFKILKFRTMRCDAEADGPGWTTKNDDRVTLIGKFLRSTSIDELPQLINVLMGDMSIVGPRPERPVYITEFRSRIPNYMLRHKVPAGITGWAQVNGWRGDTSIDKRIEYDLYYISNWSVLFDVKIVLLTLYRGLIHKNAY